MRESASSAVIVLLWAFALVLALLVSWPQRFNLTNLDAVSYLDVADAWRTGRWADVVNGYWSPAYSWVLALAAAIVRPPPAYEYVLLHAVHIVLFVVALAAFHALVQEFVNSVPRNEATATWRPNEFTSLAFLVFTWFALTQFVVWRESADLLSATSTILAAALVLRIQRRGSIRAAAALGAVLGFGYLSKTAMLPVAPLFIATAAMAAPGRRLRILVTASLALALVAGPWILALSLSRGRPTIGDSGPINYLWNVNRTEDWPRNWPRHWPHWDGGEGKGAPVHPARLVHENPAVYEFATPFAVTYPMWYDISYWYEGVSPRFDARDQLRRLRMSASRFVTMLTANRYDAAHPNPQPLLFVVLLVTWLASPRPWVRWKPAWPVIVSAAGILLLYAAVRVTPRYVGAAMLVIWIAVLAAIRLRSAPRTERLLRMASISGSVILIAASVTVAVNEAAPGWQRMLRGERDEQNVPWQMASLLREHGVTPGVQIGIIGNAQVASRWARLGRVRIVAEMPAADAAGLADFSAETLASVIAAFQETPASMLLIETTPPVAAQHRWTMVEGTPYAVLRLQPPR